MQSTKVDQTPGDMRPTEKPPRGEKAEHTREVWDSGTTSVYGTSNQEDWEEGRGPKEPSYKKMRMRYLMEELERQQEELSAEDVEDIKDGLDSLGAALGLYYGPCLLYTSPSPRDGLLSRMPSSA